MKIRQHLVGPLALALAMAVAPAASASASTCQAQWGSLVKNRAPSTSEQITDVRSGRHRCFDRLVVDLDARGGGRPGYRVGYVKSVVMDGSGTKVPLRGGARLQVIVKAPAYDDNGAPTYTPANPKELVDVSGYRSFRQVAFAGSFEGWTTIGLGVRARLPMRAFVLNDADGGHRVVVDVAHRWY
jgi:hypothetical protein